ncbi:MAG TPA: ABC transporter transmembrane domain-containing protein, partial [Bdellovibrionales bacterium]|nr:ABC transporter transmembrane domain-containing protein [Bdellovibrionales bacterium]
MTSQTPAASAPLTSCLQVFVSRLGLAVDPVALAQELALAGRPGLAQLAESLEARGLTARLYREPQARLWPRRRFGFLQEGFIRYDGGLAYLVQQSGETVVLHHISRGRLELSRAEFEASWDRLLMEVAEPRLVALLKARRAMIFAAVLISLTGVLAALSVPQFYRELYDKLLAARGSGLASFALVLMSIAFVQSAIAYARRWVLSHFAERFDRDLSAHFMKCALSQPFEEVTDRRMGEMHTRLLEIATIRQARSGTRVTAVTEVLTVAASAVLLFWYSPVIGVFALLFAPIALGAHFALQKQNLSLIKRSLEQQSKAGSYVAELIRAIGTVKASR